MVVRVKTGTNFLESNLSICIRSLRRSCPDVVISPIGISPKQLDSRPRFMCTEMFAVA